MANRTPKNAVDASIVLDTVDFKVKLDGTSYSGIANVSMNFSPGPDITFATTFTDVNGKQAADRLVFSHDRISIELPKRQVKIDGYLNGSDEFVLAKLYVEAGPPSVEMSYATVQIFNAPIFFATANDDISDSANQQRLNSITLNTAGWRIDIACSRLIGLVDEGQRKDRGWILTHTANLSRVDKSNFSAGECDDQVRYFHLFLAFMFGRWTAVGNTAGFNADGTKVLQCWGVHNGTGGPWRGSRSCFSSLHGEMLRQAYPGFHSLCVSEIWRDRIHEIIYWYCSAGGHEIVETDTGLILAQAAFELIAWLHCVRERNMISERAFGRRGLRAADRMRLLMTSLAIPKAIPDELKTLLKRPGSKWLDCPHAITSIRNSLVHPKRDKKLRALEVNDVHLLAMWLMDVILLALCKYNGDYSNRTRTEKWKGQVDRVPWAAPA